MKVWIVLWVGTTLEMLNIILFYINFFQVAICKKRSHLIGCYIGGILLQVLGYVFLGKGSESTINLFYWLVIPLFCFEKRQKKWFALYPYVWIGQSIIGICASFILAVLMKQPEGKIIYLDWVELLCEIVCLILMIIIFLYRRIRKHPPLEVEIGAKQYVILYSGMLCCFVMISASQAYGSEDKMPISLANVSGMAVSLFCGVFIILSLWQGIIMYRQIYYKSQSEMLENYMHLQDDYIHKMIENDHSMKEFRHDIRAHMTMLQSLIEDKEYDRALQYFDSIGQRLDYKAHVQYTGDSVVDAVLCEMSAQAQVQGINVESEVHISGNGGIDSFDLSLVCSNLLKNAIEGFAVTEENSEHKIQFSLYQLEKTVCIKVQNPVDRQIEIYDNKLQTSKKDSRNHGLGTVIVRKIAEKYNGEAKYRCEDGLFSAEVMFYL